MPRDLHEHYLLALYGFAFELDFDVRFAVAWEEAEDGLINVLVITANWDALILD